MLLYLTASPIPEPSAWLLLILGTGLLWVRSSPARRQSSRPSI
jgi:hypothetical protein